MKFTLLMLMCSYVAGECMPPHPMPTKYNDMYSCMEAGYEEAKNKTLKVGTEQVNKDLIYIKFYCTPDTRPQI